MKRVENNAPCVVSGIGIQRSNNSREGLPLLIRGSVSKPLPIIERHIPNDVLGEVIRFPMRHLGMVFHHFADSRPMPFMLALPRRRAMW